MIAPGTIHVRPSRGFASMMQDRERKRAMLSTMGRKRQVRPKKVIYPPRLSAPRTCVLPSQHESQTACTLRNPSVV